MCIFHVGWRWRARADRSDFISLFANLLILNQATFILRIVCAKFIQGSVSSLQLTTPKQSCLWIFNNVIVDNIIAIAADRIEIGNHLLGIVVIMSNNGIISCYDESLRLLWKISVYESNLINMSTLIVSNSALTISKQKTCGVRSVIYVSISYSISPKHFIKARILFFFLYSHE